MHPTKRCRPIAKSRPRKRLFLRVANHCFRFTVVRSALFGVIQIRIGGNPNRATGNVGRMSDGSGHALFLSLIASLFISGSGAALVVFILLNVLATFSVKV